MAWRMTMYNELTQKDIDKMNEELDYRVLVLRPQILDEVKFARSHGDLSENAEYHAAKRERGRNESRIRYLKNMIKTATVISDESREDEVGLYDKVTLLMAGTKEMTVGLVTTFGHDSLSGLISKESPVGKAILGKKVGDTVTVNVNADMSYPVKILAINKGAVENKQI